MNTKESSKEDIFNIFEYQYLATGDYTVIATAYAGNLIDNQTIDIII